MGGSVEEFMDLWVNELKEGCVNVMKNALVYEFVDGRRVD